MAKKPVTKKDKFDSPKLEGGKRDLKADAKELKKAKKSVKRKPKMGMMRG